MPKIKSVAFLLGAALLVGLPPSPVHGQGVREPVWAGRFYDSDPKELGRLLDRLLEEARPPEFSTEGLTALIVPHAGYVYSGKVAAHGYRLVLGKDIQTVIILGTAHRHGFSGCSIYPGGSYRTPLGTVEVDHEAAQALSEATGFGFIPQAHRQEHSIEVQVPFIQKVLPGARILPVLVGQPSSRTADRLAEGLDRILLGRRALIVASTDLSHFLAKSEAAVHDAETIRMIREGDTRELLHDLEKRENRMCGGCGAAAALILARKRGRPRVEVLRYADSSDAGGPRDRVVGYLAAAVFSETSNPSFSLTEDDKRALLELARKSLELYVRERRVPEEFSASPVLRRKRGAFVTLRKNRRLRGCIGFIEPSDELYRTVIRAAVFAADRDARFQPVSPGELHEIDIEISILTLPRRIDDPKSIEVGRHGLVISRDGRRGLLLPQVPTEQRWNRRTYLEQACLKAGLPRDAWKHGAEIQVFEAIVFSEN